MFKEKETPKHFEGEEKEMEKSLSHAELPVCKYCGEVIRLGTEEYHMSKQCISEDDDKFSEKEKVMVRECAYCGKPVLPGTDDYHKSKQCVLHKENEKFPNKDEFKKNNKE